LFFLSQVEYPIQFLRETVPLNSPGCFESGDFFLGILTVIH
jgi:hypothetical protein